MRILQDQAQFYVRVCQAYHINPNQPALAVLYYPLALWRKMRMCKFNIQGSVGGVGKVGRIEGIAVGLYCYLVIFEWVGDEGDR